MHNEDGFAAEDRRPTRGNTVQRLCRPRLRTHNASLSPSSSPQSSECLSSLLWIYFLLQSFVRDNKILTYIESSHTSCRFGNLFSPLQCSLNFSYLI